MRQSARFATALAVVAVVASALLAVALPKSTQAKKPELITITFTLAGREFTVTGIEEDTDTAFHEEEMQVLSPRHSFQERWSAVAFREPSGKP